MKERHPLTHRLIKGLSAGVLTIGINTALADNSLVYAEKNHLTETANEIPQINGTDWLTDQQNNQNTEDYNLGNEVNNMLNEGCWQVVISRNRQSDNEVICYLRDSSNKNQSLSKPKAPKSR